MAKDAKKVQTKAKINWGWDAPEDRDGKASRSTKPKKSKNRLKNLGIKSVLIVLLVTLIGAAIGVGVGFILSRDDCFEMIGKDEITLTLKEDGEEISSKNSYYDEGVKIISFGRDISNKAYIKTDLKQNKDGSYYADEAGTYYIIYQVNDIKYGKLFTIQRIRLITFIESTPDNNID